MSEHDSLDRPRTGMEDPGVRAIRRRSLIVRRTKVAALIGLGLLVAAGGAMLASRARQPDTMANDSAAQARRYVRTILPKHAEGGQQIALPGTLQGQSETAIYARSNGYLLRWTHDIGSFVKQGEVLAEIDTPEVDQQLAQAIATQAQMAAALELARSSARRWERMAEEGMVSQQGLDERRSGLSQAQANLAAANSNIRRLRETQALKRITAPFNGIITERHANVGDLVGANGGNANRPLFVLTGRDHLRLYVQVPQTYAGDIKAGMQVKVTQAELPGQLIAGEVVRTSGSINPQTRTMQVEIALKNVRDTLMPGAYVQVSMPVGPRRALLLPTNTLLFRREGLQVALLGTDSRVHLKPVVIGHNFGAEVEVLLGVNEHDRVILNPPETLMENDVVTATTGA